MSTTTGQAGTIYLLHFDRPYQHARHYPSTQWTESSESLPARPGSRGTPPGTAPGSWRSPTRRDHLAARAHLGRPAGP
jgi:hypothetical protein